MIHGLFEVVPGIYQVRGYDIACITFIQGETGNVGNGIGMTAPIGVSSLIAPTKYIKGDETLVIDGVEFQFIMAPQTEAP